MRFAVSTYSFHRFGAGPEGEVQPSLLEMIDRASALGFDGIELLGVHFNSTDADALNAVKLRAFDRAIDLVAVSAHHNFVHPDESVRAREVEKLIRWVRVAAAIGAPAVRCFGGRWATRPDFAEFMAKRGEEPPLDGYSDEDGYEWSADCFRSAASVAAEVGVRLLLENHWGFTGTAQGVVRLLRDTNSPWVQVVLDIGNFNFLPDPYTEMASIAPWVRLVHAKTYLGGGIYYTADLDYRKIAQMLRSAGFDGYVSLEFEGRDHPDTAVPMSLQILKDAFGSV